MSAVAVQVRDVTRLKRWAMWTGRILSALPILILLMSARLKLTHDPLYVQEWERIGYAASALPRLALLQLACVVLYVIPRTAVLGAVLLTGYLGGAISAYVRLGEPYPLLIPLSTALLAWAGIYLREERLRALLPFRRNAADNVSERRPLAIATAFMTVAVLSQQPHTVSWVATWQLNLAKARYAAGGDVVHTASGDVRCSRQLILLGSPPDQEA